MTLSEKGRVFHHVGAMTENYLSPIEDRRYRGIHRSSAFEDESDQLGNMWQMKKKHVLEGLRI